MTDPTAWVDVPVAGFVAAGDVQAAWRRDELPGVLMSLAASGMAAVGGEVCVVEGSLCSPLVPLASGGWGVLTWDAPEREDGESWAHFAQRCVEETVEAVRGLRAESQVGPECASSVRYRVRAVDEGDYMASREVAA